MIDNVSSLTYLNSLSAPGKNSNSPEKVKDAAQQFEALMIAQLLKSAKGDDASGGWLGTGEEDETGQTSIEMAEQQFASVIAKNGGLGLTKFIVGGLEQKAGIKK